MHPISYGSNGVAAAAVKKQKFIYEFMSYNVITVYINTTYGGEPFLVSIDIFNLCSIQLYTLGIKWTLNCTAEIR